MKNKTLRTPAELLVSAALAEAGVIENGAADGVSQNTAARINADRMALLNSRNTAEAGKATLRGYQTVLDTSLTDCRKFIVTGRDILKPRLGTRYSRVWDAAGMQGSLAAPKSADEVQAVMEAFKEYFTANDAHEDPSLDITAARATTLLTNLVAARAAVNNQKWVVSTAGKDRDEKADKLKTRIRGLINELGQLLDPMDAKWKAYGFNIPGALATPDQVENVLATTLSPTAAALKWDATARAAYYRVWIKVIGVDEEPVAVGSPADLDFTLENLPVASTIEIYVSAINSGGEGPLSEKVTIVTHA